MALVRSQPESGWHLALDRPGREPSSPARLTATAALLVALALSPIFALSLAIQLAVGVCIGFFGAYQAALVLSATPVESRARALGLIATAIGLTPFGMLLIGGLSSTAGAQVAIVTTGTLGLIGLLSVLSFNRSLREAQIAIDTASS